MGLPDGYPFVLSPPAVEKLKFVHETLNAGTTLRKLSSFRFLAGSRASDSSTELHDRLIDCQAITRFRHDFGNNAVVFSLQDVLHLHGLDDHQVLTV